MVKIINFSKILFVLLSVTSYVGVQGFSPNTHRMGNRIYHNSISISSRSKTNNNNGVILLYKPSDIAKSPRYSTTSNLHAAPIDEIVSMYKYSLTQNPLETKLITGGILAFFGDAIAQSRETEYDVKRAFAFVTFDIFYRAVQCAIFPFIVENFHGQYISPLLLNFAITNVGTSASLEQTFANQFVVIPFLYYPVFYALTGYVHGLSFDATIERAKTTIIPLLKRNWLFWLPVQYFQFGYIDEPLQIPFLCVAGLAWTFILSVAAGSVKDYGKESSSLEVERAYGYDEKIAFEVSKQQEKLLRISTKAAEVVEV